MDRRALEASLLQTLDDQRLSRSEKKALPESIRRLGTADRASLHVVAFDLTQKAIDGNDWSPQVLDAHEVLLEEADAPSSNAWLRLGDGRFTGS